MVPVYISSEQGEAKTNIHLSDIRYYFWSYTKKDLVLYLVLFPLVFLMAFAAAERGGPMMNSRLLSMTERLIASCFVSVVLPAFSLMQYLSFRSLMKSIEKQWPTEEDKKKLSDNFAESVSVFNGTMRIGKDYTFLVMEQKIVDTKQILYFYSKSSGGRAPKTEVIATVQVQEAVSSEKEITVCYLGALKKGKEEAADLINEATSVLRTMQKE